MPVAGSARPDPGWCKLAAARPTPGSATLTAPGFGSREPTFPGCMIEARPVGLFRMRDEKGPDAKILCIPLGDPMWNYIKTLDDVPPHLLKEIEHFFKVYKDLEEKKTGIEGWEGLDSALKDIKEAQERFKAQPV